MEHSWVEISKKALFHNIGMTLLTLNQGVKLFVVLKANAYGHGLAEVAEALQEQVDAIVVVNLDEARTLREHGINRPIIVIGYYDEHRDALEWAANERVELSVSDLSQARRMQKNCSHAILRVHINVDTGMGRQGIVWNEAYDAILAIHNECPNLRIKGIHSHFSDTINHEAYTLEQLKRFKEIQFALFKAGLENVVFHMAKTDAIWGMPDSQFDAVRLGIGLYGLWPDKKLVDRVRMHHPEFTLRPALTWKALTVQTKTYPQGEYIGYGCTYKAPRNMRIAVIPVGYFEGIDRKCSNRGMILIKGKPCPIVGRVCMNLTMVDVTSIPAIASGEEAVIIGTQGESSIHADEIATLSGTVNYEVVTRINPHIKRFVVE